MTITAEHLRSWSERLCVLPPVDFVEALAGLGLPGALVSLSGDYAIVEPPPAGVARVGLSREHLGRNQGRLGAVEVMFERPALVRAELDRWFGDGSLLPRVDFDRPHVVAYCVTVAGAAFRCSVFASFRELPGAATAMTQIALRRDVARPMASVGLG